jgi:hypothetical protein
MPNEDAAVIAALLSSILLRTAVISANLLFTVQVHYAIRDGRLMQNTPVITGMVIFGQLMNIGRGANPILSVGILWIAFGELFGYGPLGAIRQDNRRGGKKRGTHEDVTPDSSDDIYKLKTPFELPAGATIYTAIDKNDVFMKLSEYFKMSDEDAKALLNILNQYETYDDFLNLYNIAKPPSTDVMKSSSKTPSSGGKSTRKRVRSSTRSLRT